MIGVPPDPRNIFFRRHKTTLVLLCVVAAALAARSAFLLSFTESPLFGFFFADQMYYRNWALRIASGDWRPHGVFEQGPLYPYLLSLLYAVAGPGDVPVLIAQSLCGVATVSLVFACSHRLFGLRTAAAAGFFAALYGPSIFYESQAMKTFLEPLLVTSALYCTLRFGEQQRVRWLAGAGAALGLACLVREIHALLLPIVLVSAWFESSQMVAVTRPRRSRALLVTVAAFLLPILPAAIGNYLTAGEGVLVTAGGGEVFYMAFGPEARPYYHPPDFVRPIPHLEHLDFQDEASMRTGTHLSAADSSRYWFRQAIQAAWASPLRVLRLMASRGVLLFNDFEVPDSESILVARDLVPPLRAMPTFGWFLGLGLLGIGLVWRESPQTRLLIAFLLTLMVQVLLTYNYGRFRAALATVWLLLAGRGAVWLFEISIKPQNWRRLQTWFAYAVVALSSIIAFASPPGVPATWLAMDLQGYRQELTSAAQHRRAVTALRQALAKQPDDPWLLDSLGTSVENAGRGYEAVPFYEAAVRLDPTLLPSHWRLADIYYREGSLDAAALHARAVVNLEPGSPEAQVALGVFVTRQALASRHPEESRTLLREAENHFHEAIRLAPDNGLAYYYRGKMRVLNGRAAEGEADLLQAPRLTEGHLHLSLPW